MIIYNYANRPIEVELPDKTISEIFVDVITGDETGFVKFEDGSKLYFDASDDRLQDYNDGFYFVTKEKVESWLNFKPSEKRMTFSYERQELFDDD